ncbi:hypothetical protein ACOSQ3_023201 [Xanthoceras sorbifolium]
MTPINESTVYARHESPSASINGNQAFHIYDISSDEYDSCAAKDPPPRSESSEDDSEYFSYSKSYFSEADSDLSLSSDDDMSSEEEDKEH